MLLSLEGKKLICSHEDVFNCHSNNRSLNLSIQSNCVITHDPKEVKDRRYDHRLFCSKSVVITV